MVVQRIYNTKTSNWEQIVDASMLTEATAQTLVDAKAYTDTKISDYAALNVDTVPVNGLKVVDGKLLYLDSDTNIWHEIAGGTGVISKNYRYILPTTTIGQNKWTIPLSTIDPVNDAVFISYNTTFLSEADYTITTNGANKELTINDIPSNQPIANNSVYIIIIQNGLSDGTNEISGQLLINGTVTSDKLDAQALEKLNSRVIQCGVVGSVITGMQEQVLTMPFNCEVKSVDITLLEQSASPLYINIKKTIDFVTWVDVFPSNMELLALTHKVTVTVATPIALSKGETIRVYVDSATNDGKSLAINLNTQLI